MNHRAIFAAVMVAAALSASPAWANFIDNRTSWNELSSAGKAGFAIGAYDMLVSTGLGDLDAESRAYAMGRIRCVRDAKLSNLDMAALIDRGYEDVATWTKTPVEMLIRQLNVVCRESIERELKSR
jgi:hypothetical protein